MNQYIEQTFPVECKGRDSVGREVLKEFVQVQVRISNHPGTNTISSDVRCQYIGGGHGEKCRALSSDIGNVTSGTCPYSFDIPHALEKKRLAL